MNASEPLNSVALRIEYTESTAFENHTKNLILEAEDKISRIDSQIRDLTRQREQEHENIMKLRAAIAPIRKVPTELLAEIFDLVVNSIDYYPYKEGVLLLSGVCAFWRQIVQNTPRLWTDLGDIGVNGSLNDKISDPYMITVLQTRLARSAPLPIPIRILYDAPTGAVLKLLLPSANRWKSLELVTDALSCLNDLPPGSLRMLETLDIWNHCKGLPVVKAFLSAHRLRQVALDVDDTLKFPMPWLQLTSIEITDNCPFKCREILTECRNVVEANFFTRLWAFDDQIPDLPITILPRLEKLIIVFAGYSGTSVHFFQPLALPALKTLELTYPFKPHPHWSRSMVTDFQLRSPNIERFISDNCPMHPDDLIAFLRHAPALRELTLEHCSSCIDNNLCDMLRYHEGDVAPLVPALEDLVMLHIAPNVSKACIEKMIMSRWWSDEQLAKAAPSRVARWKRVCIDAQDDDDTSFSAEIQSWMEISRGQGLQVHVY